MQKTYVDTDFGQIHCRISNAVDQTQHNNILCLQPMPFSGLFYDTITPNLSSSHSVISPDYPGYGASDQIDEISIEIWAESMAATVKALGIEGGCDVIGFHTGCLVATELSLRYPALVKHLLLVDVPYFNATDRAEMLANNSAPPEFSEDVNCIAASWKMNVGSKLGRIPTNRALAMLAEHLRTGENANRGYAAAFRYDADQLQKITHDTLVIASDSGLFAPSQQAAKLIKNCELCERKDIKAPAFEVYAQELADEILDYLA